MSDDAQAVQPDTTTAAPTEAAPAAAPEPRAEKPLSPRDALTAAAKHLEASAPKPAAKPAERPATPAKPAPGAARAPDGRFARQGEPETPAAPRAAEQAAQEPEKAPEGELEKPAEAPAAEARAPQSWKPAVRELAARLPAEFKPILEEAHRREREASVAIQQGAERGKLGEAFRERVAPFEALFRSANVDPLTGVNQLLQTAWILNTGAPQQRAQAIGTMIRNFLGTDDQAITMLGQVLDASTAAPAARQQQQIDPAAIAARVEQSILGRLQQERVQRRVGEVETWGAGKEFFADVRGDMADLVELYAKRGKSLTTDQAYDLAVSMNPELSAIVKQRGAAKAAETAGAATRRAEVASSSLRSAPGAVPPAAGGKSLSMNQALRQAKADVEGRGRV